MYKNRDISDCLQDIFNAIEDIFCFTEGMDYDAFKTDKKTINAVIRSLEVIGEAAKLVPDDFRKEHPTIPWSKMAGMRDVLIHDYMGVDIKTVWKVVEDRLPELSTRIKSLLSR